MTLAKASERTKAITGQHIAEVSLRAAAERGALQATKRGGDWYVTESALRAYLKQRPQHFREKTRSDVVGSGGRNISIKKKTVVDRTH